MPKISVVMPVYNGEKYIRETMDSILSQTYSDFEFIIINDASKDSTEEIIKSYDDERIVYVKNEQNLGVAGALNRGLSLAQGEFIARMDADDISMPQRFEKQVKFLEQNKEYVICGSNMYLFGAQEGKTVVPHTNAEIRANLLFASPFAHPTVMMRRSYLVENNLMYNPKYEGVEDYAMWLDFASFGDGKFYNFSEVLLRYRIHPNQVTQKELSPQRKAALKEIKARAFKLIAGEENFPILIGDKSELSYKMVIDMYNECRDLMEKCDKSYHNTIKFAVSGFGYQHYDKFSGRQMLNLLINHSDICAFSNKLKLKMCLLIIKQILSGVKSRIKSYIKKRKNRLKLKNREFTIISNNCWGGLISQKYGLPYRSPTCGLLILGDDYIKFCANLKYYLSQKLEFVDFSEGKYSEMFKDMQFPVAKLGDIEIYFMHYQTEEEASEKWYRRAKRINWDCIIYKISERETFTPENMSDFAKLPLENKLIFASKKYTEDTVVIDNLDTFVGDETPLLEKSFDEAEYLNRIKK